MDLLDLPMGEIMSTVLISGASSGLGWALALCYAEPGTTIHLLARRADRLSALSFEISKRGSHAVIHKEDVRDRHRMESLAKKILDADGSPSLIIANAGVSGESGGNDAQTMKEILDTNVLGVLHTVLPFLPAMKTAGSGRIAIIGSLAGYRGLTKGGAYCASKAALSAWTDVIRYESESSGLTVSLVNPGFIKTEMTRHNPPMPFVLSADEAARRIRIGIDKGAARIEFPLFLVLLVRFLTLLPPRWGDRILRLSSSSS